MPRLLDAFCCAGLGANGYHWAGWEVTGVDNNKRALRHYPYESFHADALEVLSDLSFISGFDPIHASPPCQGYSATRELAVAQGKGQGRAVNLVPQTRELLDRAGEMGLAWVIENVERSPLREWPGTITLCGSSWGLKVQRHRLFASNVPLIGRPCNHDVFDRDERTGKPRPWGVYYAKDDEIPKGGRTVKTLEQGHDVMGVSHRQVPWEYLCEGLPPAYTYWIGRQLMDNYKSDKGEKRQRAEV